MSARRGVLSAGSFCVDFNKSIARWPDEDTVTEVLRIDRQGGGSGYNMAIDLKRLDPAFPVEAPTARPTSRRLSAPSPRRWNSARWAGSSPIFPRARS
jgi:hypothetical protein